MSSVKLDITSLNNAVHRLREGLERYLSDTSDIQIRDGLIQRFAFTYEISHKMVKRFLEMTSANPADFDEMNFQDIIRTANERKILSGDWSSWRVFRDMRARTSHAYDEDVAIQVVKGIPDFLAEAEFLLQSLKNELQ